MKVVLLNDTSQHGNWGCVATSAGLKSNIRKQMPDATLVAYPAEKLPFANMTFRRRRLDRKIIGAIHQTQAAEDLSSLLAQYRFDLSQVSGADHVILNGEGMIHRNSGHLVRLLGILELAKRLGSKTAIVNQTVDIDPDGNSMALLESVFLGTDSVFVRDTDSFAFLQSRGLEKAKLVPDAAFATQVPNQQEITEVVTAHNLPKHFITMTGSSALNKSSVSEFSSVYQAIKNTYELPVVILASTKTDLRLASKLGSLESSPIVIDARTSHREVVSIIAASEALVGGRFHPLIFAALVGTPILGFSGNTHKVRGLLNYLEYPISEQNWKDMDITLKALKELKASSASLSSALKSKAESLSSELANTLYFEEDQ
jgi:polysaccharide pyruvyl transferase WcaK-like protein